MPHRAKEPAARPRRGGALTADPAWRAAVDRLCRALWRSPTLQRYRRLHAQSQDLAIEPNWEVTGDDEPDHS